VDRWIKYYRCRQWQRLSLARERHPGGRLSVTPALRRAKPRTLAEGAQDLAARTGVDAMICLEQIRAFFQLGSAVRDQDDKPGFTFKLHQFISQGAVYSTLELTFGPVFPPTAREPGVNR